MQGDVHSDHEIVKADSLELASKEHSDGSTEFEIDPHEERRLLRKLDILLLPLFTLICGYYRSIPEVRVLTDVVVAPRLL